MKTRNAENFMRSTTAPRISAGVMIANMPWKTTKTISGMYADRIRAVVRDHRRQVDAGEARLARSRR